MHTRGGLGATLDAGPCSLPCLTWISLSFFPLLTNCAVTFRDSPVLSSHLPIGSIVLCVPGFCGVKLRFSYFVRKSFYPTGPSSQITIRFFLKKCLPGTNTLVTLSCRRGEGVKPPLPQRRDRLAHHCTSM